MNNNSGAAPTNRLPSKAYAKKEGFEALDFFQAYWLFDELGMLPQGSEVFSLLRESDLETELYLDSFFDTGTERLTDYCTTSPKLKSEAEGAAPNP